jgi:hypothetical protein
MCLTTEEETLFDQIERERLTTPEILPGGWPDCVGIRKLPRLIAKPWPLPLMSTA